MAGRQVWKTPLDPYPVYGDFGTGASPVLAGDRLLILSDNEKQQFIAAFDTKSGKEVAYDGAIYAQTGALGYRARIEGGTAFTSSPWAYDGKVFCLNEEGETFVIAAGEKYELLNVNDLDEMAQATPALVGDRLLLRTQCRIYSIGRRP